MTKRLLTKSRIRERGEEKIFIFNKLGQTLHLTWIEQLA
jgi:hypothetical protein